MKRHVEQLLDSKMVGQAFELINTWTTREDSKSETVTLALRESFCKVVRIIFPAKMTGDAAEWRLAAALAASFFSTNDVQIRAAGQTHSEEICQ
eukprot:7438252-Heterocapsa_arctica.AAC.1